jgi:hypothetical protein
LQYLAGVDQEWQGIFDGLDKPPTISRAVARITGQTLADFAPTARFIFRNYCPRRNTHPSP